MVSKSYKVHNWGTSIANYWCSWISRKSCINYSPSIKVWKLNLSIFWMIPICKNVFWRDWVQSAKPPIIRLGLSQFAFPIHKPLSPLCLKEMSGWNLNLDQFGVFCHGNFCRENILFKYKSNLESRLSCCEVSDEKDWPMRFVTTDQSQVWKCLLKF